MSDAQNTENVRMALTDLRDEIAAQVRRLTDLLAYKPLKQPMDAHRKRMWDDRFRRARRALEIVSEEIHGMQQGAQ